ncbi:hypothetical protein [Halopiger xanaduensis]|uniref:dolichyl-phosphooligosaccharide-protein glycotransferase n=1 Tax=Halopiger xanaduensis (strain DSM 18323 / JCM 14033 / SH-6) TaxID=797210 RepID=F8DA39_HALXS|nr:hypothetical protein [Halopiger xanaduensis]AEH36960.1 hypothetical protein Halxa_2338 [Halopiger xanaduensis SH-6]
MTDDDSSAVADATTAFLEDHEDGERVLEAVLEVDVDAETWTFDDVALDSGTFGELVSRGIVEKHDGEYRVADEPVVQAVLAGDEIVTESTDAQDERSFSFKYDIDARALSALLGALAVVAAARMLVYNRVFQRGYVVSPGNDPYFFRYWMERLLAKSSGPTDYGVLVDTGWTRPSSHATNWFLAELLGGDQWAADIVAAWLPIVASVALAALIYKLTVLLTRDVRVGIASVLLFAVTPTHVVYTELGFIDHQLHQYFWLGVTLLTLGWLAVDLQHRLETGGVVSDHLRSPATWVVACTFGISVAVGTHAWGGSPLLLLPLAGYIALRAAMDAREGVPSLQANLPLLAGLALGAVISITLNVRWGWHETFVSATPAMVLAGGTVVFTLGELWRRREVHLGGLVAVEAVVAAIGLFAFRRLRPEDWAAAQQRIDDLFFREGASETMSLFATEYAVFFGPLYQLGVGFYLGLVVLGWVVWLVYRRYEPGWLLVGTYTGYLLVLAGIQVRFASQLAIPLAILGGLGFVYVLSAVDLARRPVPFRGDSPSPADRARAPSLASDGGRSEPSIALPDGRAAVYVVGIFLLVFGMSLIYVPGLTSDVAYDDSQVAALEAIDDHAGSVEREYPSNYVLSEWGDNRMYNHFVNGESQGYGYAQSNYVDFVTGSDPDGWYDRFDGRVGYVVLTDVERDVPADSTQAQLFERYGSAGNETDGVAHYQALFVDDDVAAFAVVPGATLDVSGEAGSSVPLETTVSVSDESITYERDVAIGDDGQGTVTVPYAGEYAVGNQTVTVSEDDVLNGQSVSVGD